MADYSIIADVSNYLTRMLRSKMCPEPIPSANNIQISTPMSQDVDYLVGLYLYDITELADVATGGPMRTGRMQLRKQPRPFILNYMIFINGTSQMGLKEPDIHKIIGKVAQIINDNDLIDPKELQPWLEVQEPPIQFSQAKINFEQKIRIWQSLHKPYQLALYYKVAPVFLSSEIISETPLVTEATFTVGGSSQKRGNQ